MSTDLTRTTAGLSQQQFCDRFTNEMIRIVGNTFSDGDSVENYARDTAPSYFHEQYSADPQSTPEEWAACDISYWEPA